MNPIRVFPWLLLVAAAPLAVAAQEPAAPPEEPALVADAPAAPFVVAPAEGTIPSVEPGRRCQWAAEDPVEAAWLPCDRLEQPAGGGVLWQRITIPPSPPGSAVSLRAPVGEVELWIGGRKVFPFTERQPGAADSGGNVILPLGAGGTDLQARLSGRTAAAGGLGEVVIGDEFTLALALARATVPSLASVVLLVLLLVGALVAAAFDSGRRLAMLLSLYALSALAVTIGLSALPSLYFGAMGMFQRASLLGAAFIGPLLLLLVEESVVTRQEAWIRPVSRLLFSVAIAYAALALLDFDVAQRFLGVIVLLVVAGIGAAVVAAVGAWRSGNGDAVTFLIAISALLVVSVADSLMVLGATNQGYYLSGLGYPFVGLAFVLILQSRADAATEALALRQRSVEATEEQAGQRSARLEDGASALLGVASRLDEATRSQTERATRQAAALQQSQVTAEEIRRTSETAAEKAKALHASAETVDIASRRGDDAIEATLASIAEVGREVAEMARKVGAVDELTRELSTVVGTVADIADQTNVLALNAAIEALRAGDSGRGVSVVAREIRRLADQSITATGRIREILHRVGGRLREASEVSARGESRIAAGLDEVRRTGDQLRILSTILRETHASARQIAAAVTQQHAGVAQIFEALAELSTQADEILRRVEETTRAAEAVVRVAGELTQATAPLSGRAS